LNGWSIVFLTNKLNKKNIDNVNLYKEKFNKKNFEIIIINNKSDIKLNNKKIRLINLGSSNFTLGFKRNLGLSLCNYKNILMVLDYTRPIKMNLEKLEYEIKKYDIICPKLLTLDNKRYLDWMYLDYPKIGKSYAPYDSSKIKYMYFHGTSYVFKKKFIINNLFSSYLDNKEGEDVSWSLKVRKYCSAKLSNNIILQVERKSKENEVISNSHFQINNKKILKINK
jgi:hypothetical protein